MTTTDKVSNTRRKCDAQTKVQVRFRAPRIWSDFLKKKAAEECCTRSDLLRHAFMLAYGSELKEYRINPGDDSGEDHHSSCSEQRNPTEVRFSPSNTQTLVPYKIESDPWVESMGAFVANKLSPQTNRAYRLVLNQFLTFVSKHPSDVKQSDVIRYRHQLEHLERAPSSIRQYLAAISGYYTFCISRDLTLSNPVKGVNRPSVNAYTNATWLANDQAKALLSQPNLNTVKGKRDYAILGKNGHNGHHPITPEAIRQMVTYYSRRAFGEEVKVSPHTLRHTAGTLLRKSGRSIEEVQSFLKHKRVDTTRRYLHVVEAEDSEFGECIAKMLDL